MVVKGYEIKEFVSDEEGIERTRLAKKWGVPAYPEPLKAVEVQTFS